MAKIIVGSYMVRYPLGGMMSWVLQYLVGFRQLGHEVYFVEKAGYANACFDPATGRLGDDCRRGTRAVRELLAAFGLRDRWCFVDVTGGYHGLSRREVETAFREADLFLDMGTHGAWLEEAEPSGLRVLADGEPGFTQIKLAQRQQAGLKLNDYDFHYTAGANTDAVRNVFSGEGHSWRSLCHPVATELFAPHPPPDDAAFTTVMNWQSHRPLEFRGKQYGQKDVEFEKFRSLPSRVNVPLELAVAGKKIPRTELQREGWWLRDAHRVTRSFDSFRQYLSESRGEFSVCKHVFVELRTGWFSDRSAAYLASGRPVVLQDTGFSKHLPCGRGLFAVRSVEDAVAALETIQADYPRHAKWARELACEHLEATRVLARFLAELGIT